MTLKRAVIKIVRKCQQIISNLCFYYYAQDNCNQTIPFLQSHPCGKFPYPTYQQKYRCTTLFYQSQLKYAILTKSILPNFYAIFFMMLFGPCAHVQMTIDYMSGMNSKFMERYGFSSPTVWPCTCILLMFTFMYKDVRNFFLCDFFDIG